jgi:hypothetical protein
MTLKQEVAIRKHGEQLNAIFHTGLDPVVLCKKLRRIEGAAHKLAEDACNYLSMESGEFAHRKNLLTARITSLLLLEPMKPTNKGVFINLDPRGYALKIDNQYMRDHNLQLHRDMGGYGILAPEIGKDGE